MSLHRGVRPHGWLVAAVVVTALVAGHVALFRSVIARFGRTTLVVGAVVVIALVKLVLVLLLRRRATS